MAKVPDTIQPIPHSDSLQDLLSNACQQCQAQEPDLLDWAVKRNAVVLILPLGQKITFPIASQPFLPPEEHQPEKKPPKPRSKPPKE